MSTDSAAEIFLKSVLQPADGNDAAIPETRPRVTLTFAQSLDGKIAGDKGQQLILSGNESMLMTHWMRTMHDGILVGIGTALNDDPQLNTRHLPPPPPGVQRNVPRPIVLDSRLRLGEKPACKLLQNYKAGRGRRPWVVCLPVKRGEMAERRKVLEREGARVIEVEGENGVLSVRALLVKLKEMEIRTLMVEGGARVIGSFLEAAGESVDTVVVTVAPTFVGKGGVGYGRPEVAAAEGCSLSQTAQMRHVRTEIMGQDSVVALKVVR